MSAKSGPSAATTSNYSSSSQSQSVALENYLASPPTVTEALTFPSTTGDSSTVESKTGDMKESLDKWQTTWDSMKNPKN